ncbi:MAG: ATP-binding protein [Bacteroidales bacterium]|jgi:signal transduction histidine kinase|nr:ATP-binding protein [Bacteroidales bacterium]
MFKLSLNISNKPNETIQDARKQLLFLILLIINFIGLPAIVISFIEALMLKQHITALSYLLFYSPVLIITLFRKRIPYLVSVSVILISIYLLALVNIIVYAFSGAAIPLFLTFMVLTTVFLDIKYGLFAILISLISMIIAGILFVSNNINLNETISSITSKPISWITACSVLTLLGILVVLSYGIIQKKMINSQSDLKLKALDLEKTNKELKYAKEKAEISEGQVKEQNEEYLSMNEELNQTIEELNLAKEKAEESDRLKSSFLANMSHEIRTPMNGIIGFAKMLKKKDLSPEKQSSFTDIVVGSCNQLLHIVNDILDISRIETGQIDLSKDHFELNAFLKNISSFFELQAKERGITINLITDVSINEITVTLDSSRLHQIITNLISNALKFTDQGQIDFGYEIKKNQLEFFVKDSGIGIPKKHHYNIFNRFQKIEDHKDILYGGTGLGLAICKGLINKMDGEIWVESEINKGSQFYFTLPFEYANKEINEETTEMKMLRSFNNIKILIVEDDMVSFNYLEEVLSDLKIDYIHAKNGKEAVEMYKQNQTVNLILMDVRMPIMNGYAATKEIKKINPKIPIIAQTAYAMVSDRQMAIEAGCDDYISKPIEEERLIEILEKYLRR